MTAIMMPPAPRGEQHADEGHVEEPQQEQRQEHPGLKSGVALEIGSLPCHARIVVIGGDTVAKYGRCKTGKRRATVADVPSLTLNFPA